MVDGTMRELLVCAAYTKDTPRIHQGRRCSAHLVHAARPSTTAACSYLRVRMARIACAGVCRACAELVLSQCSRTSSFPGCSALCPPARGSWFGESARRKGPADHCRLQSLSALPTCILILSLSASVDNLTAALLLHHHEIEQRPFRRKESLIPTNEPLHAGETPVSFFRAVGGLHSDSRSIQAAVR